MGPCAAVLDRVNTALAMLAEALISAAVLTRSPRARAERIHRSDRSSEPAAARETMR